MASQNAIGSDKPIQVSRGALGAATLTQYGVLVGAGTGAVQVTAAGTTGQLLGATTTANPSFVASATGDFTFTSATAGATRTFTVSNTDNTNTASNAIITATTGGANAGDAQYQASTTTTTWSWGCDNSSADAFVISQGTALGTTNVKTISIAGEINRPLQSAFYAFNSATDLNVTGDGTNYTIICDTEVYDQNGDYNNGTGAFTAPVAGRYMFTAGVQLLQLAATMTAGVSAITTTSAVLYLQDSRFGPIRDVNSNLAINGTCQTNMAAGDTAIFTVAVFLGTKVVDVTGVNGATYFSGHLMC